MSTNFVNKTTGELVTLANGTRMWIGTKSAHDNAVQQGTMPNNCMVCITDDYPESSAINPTPSGDTVITQNCSYRVGNIVMVSCVVSSSVDRVSGYVLATGLPAPKEQIQCSCSGEGRAAINPNGELVLDSELTANDTMRCTITYIVE